MKIIDAKSMQESLLFALLVACRCFRSSRARNIFLIRISNCLDAIIDKWLFNIREYFLPYCV